MSTSRHFTHPGSLGEHIQATNFHSSCVLHLHSLSLFFLEGRTSCMFEEFLKDPEVLPYSPLETSSSYQQATGRISNTKGTTPSMLVRVMSDRQGMVTRSEPIIAYTSATTEPDRPETGTRFTRPRANSPSLLTLHGSMFIHRELQCAVGTRTRALL